MGIMSKVGTLDAHPIPDHGSLIEFTAFIKKAVVAGSAEHTELFWFLLEIFTEHDTDKDGNVTMRSFPAMVDKVVELPIKLGVEHKDLKMFQPHAEKREEHHKALFKQFNTRGDDRMSFDEWLNFAVEVVFKKMLL